MTKKRIKSQEKHTISVAIADEPTYDAAMFTPHQLRAARALLDWTQEDLSREASVAVMVIKKFERDQSDPRLSSMRKLKDALEKEGIVFLDATPDRGEGVAFAEKRSELTA